VNTPNPYTAPLERNEQPIRRGTFALLFDLIWAFCASMPFLWLCMMVCVFLIHGDDIPPTLVNQIAVYSTLAISLVLFLVSFVFNILSSLKRRWIAICGLVINLLSLALVVGFVVLVVIVAQQ
jgi:hypothetical protein